MTRTQLFIVIAIGLALGGVAGAKVMRDRNGPAIPAGSSTAVGDARVEGPRLVVPRAQTPIEVNGELDEAAWTSGLVARTGAFAQQPYSDARFAWRDKDLYVVLYAADEDLRAADAHHDEPLWLADSYRLAFQRGADEYVIEVSPAGVLTDWKKSNGVTDTKWESGAKIALDRDGTLNDSTDNDEEWVVEMSIPLAALGLAGTRGERIAVSIQRCDVSRPSPQRKCASWGASGGELELGE